MVGRTSAAYSGSVPSKPLVPPYTQGGRNLASGWLRALLGTDTAAHGRDARRLVSQESKVGSIGPWPLGVGRTEALGSPVLHRFEVMADQPTTFRSPSGPALRVALLDNRPERRQLMRNVVEAGPADVVVVGEAATASEAIDIVGERHVDVVIVEVQLPVEEGLQTIGQLRAGYPSLGLAVCSFHLSSDTQRQARDSGADVYLSKPITPRRLSEALAVLTFCRAFARTSGTDADRWAGVGAGL
jgi:CheY-like chemotaxis protein